MEWLFLLLPVAAASGWWVARRNETPRRRANHAAADTVFFRGLNYLLNEQPDKALDVFLKFAEIDGETAETYLALGALFRRRGEVERAIRVHQDLVARVKLPIAQRSLALYELGRDYLHAGLFDRAESLFKELVDMQMQRPLALRALIEIYQQEKDWLRCLEMAEQLKMDGNELLRIEIAQFHCELAEQYLRSNETESARFHLRTAQMVDSNCIRANLLQAEMAMTGGDARAALALYRRVAERGPRYVPTMLPGLLECYQALGYTSVAAELAQLFHAQPSTPLMLELSNALEREQGSTAALHFLTDYLRERADLAGAERLLELRLKQQQTPAVTDAILLAVVQHLLSAQPVYQCDHCGFTARVLHWQCPSCKHWGSIKAVEPGVMTGALPLPKHQLLAE
ncbi:lipopolysaccharide assembly protein LapB [Thiospirillum jenense]